MSLTKATILSIYSELLKKHKKQNWWPINNVYNNKNYKVPENDKEKFEICLGAILTQNTAWKNVEKALENLRKEKLIDPKKLINADIKELIRPAGYFNQKERKIKVFTKFYLGLKGRTPTRDELLSLWGIGKETADSILLYAYKQPIFVVDAYTRRLFGFSKEMDYDEIREKFEKALPRDYRIYNEYHALIVAEGKTLKKV